MTLGGRGQGQKGAGDEARDYFCLTRLVGGPHLTRIAQATEENPLVLLWLQTTTARRK